MTAQYQVQGDVAIITLDNPPVNGTLNGNLYLRGQGDPKLIPEELVKLVTDVRRAGVDELAGNIVLDRTYFEGGLSDAPPLDGDSARAYNVAPDALLYSFKTLTFTLNALKLLVETRPAFIIHQTQFTPLFRQTQIGVIFAQHQTIFGA